MQNPVLVEVLRGGRVESRHSGSVAICDADGALVLARGDIQTPVFPRSAVKAFQALQLLESGAADKFGLEPQEIALACASHSGEPLHAATALAMLVKAGQDEASLECGAHWPMGEAAARQLAASGGKPLALHNNCSGKHAGFICVACAGGDDPAGYIQAGHSVQREAKAAIEGMCGVNIDAAQMGIDGCSIPTWAVPLQALATGFARFGAGHGLDKGRAKAAQRIRQSVAAHPFMVAGAGRFDTDVMQVLGKAAFIKTGAEGVYCASFPALGYGVAIKMDDGAGRAAETVMAGVIGRYLPLPDSQRAELAGRMQPSLVNWNGIQVGSIRMADSWTA